VLAVHLAVRYHCDRDPSGPLRKLASHLRRRTPASRARRPGTICSGQGPRAMEDQP
jgi:hypothetical protein